MIAARNEFRTQPRSDRSGSDYHIPIDCSATFAYLVGQGTGEVSSQKARGRSRPANLISSADRREYRVGDIQR